MRLGNLHAASGDGLDHSLVELVVGVAEDDGAGAGVVVDILVAVEIPQPVALGAFDVEEVLLPALAVGRSPRGVTGGPPRSRPATLRVPPSAAHRSWRTPHICFFRDPLRLPAGYGLRVSGVNAVGRRVDRVAAR